MAALQKRAGQARLGPVRSALLRQKGLPGQSLKSVEGQLKKAKGMAKGTAGKDLAQAKKVAVPVQKQAAKDLAGLKKVAASKQQARLKMTTPSRSALLRQKGLPGQNFRSVEGELKKARGAGKGAVGTELSQAKKATVASHGPALKKVAGLSKLAGLKKAAGLKKVADLKTAPALKGAAAKATVPKRSALLRQKSLTGQALAPGGAKGGKATIGKELSGIKKGLSQSKSVRPANKVGAVDKKILQAKKPRGLGRILRTRSQMPR